MKPAKSILTIVAKPCVLCLFPVLMRKGGDALIVEIRLSNSLIQKLGRRLNLDYFKQELLKPHKAQ